ncbi:MAG: hypothetical protein ACNFW9_03415 [Candidatus Kerfeldbacteria bacterium]
MKTRKILILTCMALFVLMANGVVLADNDFEASSKAVSRIQAQDQLQTAQNFERLYNAVPPPEMQDSQERRQLVKRLNRFNVSSKISYIYLIDRGIIMAFFTVKGKVSSVNSMLTCTKQLVYDGYGTSYGRGGVHAVASPDLDGSYGTNGNGVFFFTDLDTYIEWNGKYLLCDQYIKLNQPPVLVLETEEGGK